MGNTLVSVGHAEKTKQETLPNGLTLAQYDLKMSSESRVFVVAVPGHLTSSERCSCVFFAHGVGGTAWYGAKEDTSWVDVASKGGSNPMIMVFLQSKGLFFEEKRKNTTGKLVWAASSWDYVYSSGDLQYVETVYDAVVHQLFPGIIDVEHVYFCGYDSGGMFAWPVACTMGGSKFAAVFSFNGGIDEHYLCDRKTMLHPVSSSKASTSVDSKRCPVWIAVGETYEHRQRAETACRAYKELGWPVRFDVIGGTGAEWPRNMEEDILAWFLTARDEALTTHVQQKSGN